MASRGIVQRTGMRQASIRDVNDILGTAPTGSVLSARVGGVSPGKAVCDDLAVTNTFALPGIMATSLRAYSGSITTPGITFAGDESTGIYHPAAGNLCVTSSGTRVFCATPLGFGVQNIYSPTGTIDFSGAFLANVGGIDTQNKWSYTIQTSEPILTTDNTPTLSVAIPTTTTDPATAVVMDINMRVLFANDALESGWVSYKTRVRRPGGSTVPVIAQIYDIVEYTDASLVTYNASPVVGVDEIRVIVTGIAGMNIKWEVVCNILRVEF